MSTDSAQQKVAMQVTNNIVMNIKMGSMAFQEANSRLTFMLSTAFPGIMGALQGICKNGTDKDFRPNDDHILYTCLLLANSCHRASTSEYGSDAYAVEFSIENFIKSLEHFTEITGRQFDHLMNESLLDVINTARSEAAKSFTGSMGKFLPQ